MYNKAHPWCLHYSFMGLEGIPLHNTDVLICLQCTEDGLTSAQAAQRLEQYGPNKLPEKHISPILRFLGYMWNPLSWAMEVAAIMSIALLDFADFGVILGLLFCNACIRSAHSASEIFLVSSRRSCVFSFAIPASLIRAIPHMMNPQFPPRLSSSREAGFHCIKIQRLDCAAVLLTRISWTLLCICLR